MLRPRYQVLRLALASSLITGVTSCIDDPVDGEAPGQRVLAATSTNKNTLPLEVLGAVGTAVTITVNIPNGTDLNAGLVIDFLCHSCGFDHKELDRGASAKATLSINGSSPISLKYYSGDPANVVKGSYQELFIDEAAKAYGGIGGGYRTVRIGIATRTLQVGSNTLSFSYAASSPGSNGFRIVSLDVRKRGNPALDSFGTDSILATPIRRDNPSTWTAPAAGNAAEGARWWSQRYSLTDPAYDAINGNAGAAIKAACSDCHATDGRDLKYFNYSNAAIAARARYHGLDATRADDIAAYIRSNAAAYAPDARPWNPPYQPGPGLDSRAWAAGAGLKWVLEDEDVLRRTLLRDPVTGAMRDSSLEEVRKVVDRFGTLNLRELPLAIQFPDWNQWLPRVHPIDAFDDAAGTTILTRLDESMDMFMDATDNDDRLSAVTSFRSSVYEWLSDGSNCFTQTALNGPPERTVSSKFLDHVILGEPYISRTIRELTNDSAENCSSSSSARRDSDRTWGLELAKASLMATVSVKQWELMQSNQLELVPNTLPDLDIKGTNGTIRSVSVREARGWKLDGYSVFSRAPHFIGYNSNEFSSQDPLVGAYENNVWYQLQLVLNPGFRHNGKLQENQDDSTPNHFPYTQLWIANLAERSGRFDPYRYWATYIKQRQLQTNGHYGVENGLDLRTAQPFRVYSDEHAESKVADVGAPLWGYLASAALLDLVEDASNASSLSWKNANQNSVVQKRDAPYSEIFCTTSVVVSPRSVFTAPGETQGCNTYALIDKLRSDVHVDEATLMSLIDWAKAMWPSAQPARGIAAWNAKKLP